MTRIATILLCVLCALCGQAQMPPQNAVLTDAGLSAAAPAATNVTLRLPLAGACIEASDDLRGWTYYAPAAITWTAVNDRPARFFRLAPFPPVRTLAWEASPDPDVAGYRLHFAAGTNAAPQSVDVGACTRAQVAAAGVICWATSYDDAGRESAPGNRLQL